MATIPCASVVCTGGDEVPHAIKSVSESRRCIAERVAEICPLEATVEPIVVREQTIVLAWAITMHAVRASGPGGQNVNKVASKVELHVDLRGVVGIDVEARRRLDVLANGSRDAEGRLLVVSQLTRDQHRNIEDARNKVRTLVLRALERPKPRRKTRPSRASVERRLHDKQARARKKTDRRTRND